MKSKNTVKELMAAPEVRMAMEKAERETTTATEEDEEEVVEEEVVNPILDDPVRLILLT